MSHSYWKEYADLCAETFSGQDEAQQRALGVLDKADRQIVALRASRDKLAGLLREAIRARVTPGGWSRELLASIDAALSDGDGERGGGP